MNLRAKIFKTYGIVYLGIVLLGIAAAFKIIYIDLFLKDDLSKLVSPYRTIDVVPKRGDIYDAKGRLLATSLPLYDIYFDPTVVKDSIYAAQVDSLAFMLHKFTGKSQSYYRQLFDNAREKNKRYIPIVKEINYTQKEYLKTFPIFRLGRYKGGMITNVNYRRLNPYGSLASKTIGTYDYMNNNEPTGLEAAYNSILQGSIGNIIVRKLPGGGLDTVSVNLRPVPGKDIVSTIDIDIQDIAEQALLRQLQETKAELGVVVVMDVKTGDIKAMVNLQRTKDSTYTEQVNNAVTYAYEPGSVMKLASMLALFEERDVPLNKVVPTGNGVFKLGRDFVITDYKQGGFGNLTVQQVFEKSSNVGVAKLVLSVFNTPEKQMEFVQRLREMNIGKDLKLKLKDEVSFALKEPGKDETWWTGSLVQMSIGYEMMLTPLQVLTLYNAVANDGKMIKPRCVSAVKANGKIVEQYKPEVIISSIASKKALDKVKIMLKGVVNSGTAEHYVKSDLVEIAGKTGTAQFYYRGRGYSHTDYNVTFVGYFPADKPKYSMIVMLSKPQKYKSGGAGAGPVFKEIAEKLYMRDYSMHKPQQYDIRYMPRKKTLPKVKNGSLLATKGVLSQLNIPYKYHGRKAAMMVTTRKSKHGIELYPYTINKHKGMPSLIGFGARDAVYILDALNINANIHGKGKVYKQSVSKGTELRKVQNATIYLK